MNIHEYQAKDLLRAYGVPLPTGKPAFDEQEALEAAQALGGALWVVKAQIHAGGRGKAGGVVLAHSLDDVRAAAGKLLGAPLVTHQTGPQGQMVRRLYIESGCAIAKEFYLSLVMDRGTSRIAIVASAQGGTDIEEVAASHPEKVVTQIIDPVVGVSSFHARNIAQVFELKGSAIQQLDGLLKGLYRAFRDQDATLIEINPLVQTHGGDLVALDAKMSFDDNALYRQAVVTALRDEDEEDPLEIEASKYDLSYIKLNGAIGCMVNGAGLAMATLDIIKLYGAEPANFLDVGGGATQERVCAAFKIILADPGVKAILINIFGGIMRCDIIAQGIVAAAKDVSLSVPMVVRLMGTHAAEGKAILAKSGLSIISADELDEAAQKAVAAAGGR